MAGEPVTIDIGSTAILQPDGSAIMTVTYSCLAGFGTGDTGTMYADLEETQAFGFSPATAICDDQNHTIKLDISPGPFTPGEAASDVQIITGAAEHGEAQKEVVIKRP